MVFKKPSAWLPITLGIVYLIVLYFFIGWRNSNFLIVVLILLAYYLWEESRRLVLGMFPMIIYMILYDSIRAVPNYTFREVDIERVYHLEKKWFGIKTVDGLVTPNEYFQNRTVPWLDILSGIFYGNWFNSPFILAVYFFFRHKRWLIEFGTVFLLLNIVGITTYYVYPLAPPWYVELYGFEWHSDTKPFEAGLQNFDRMFGITLFKDMYSMNSQVFAALPSLHSAFPIVVLFYGLRTLKYMNIVFVVHMIGIWFFAVYLRHHYIIDILLGVVYGIIISIVFRYFAENSKLKDWLQKTESYL